MALNENDGVVVEEAAGVGAAPAAGVPRPPNEKDGVAAALPAAAGVEALVPATAVPPNEKLGVAAALVPEAGVVVPAPGVAAPANEKLGVVAAPPAAGVATKI